MPGSRRQPTLLHGECSLTGIPQKTPPERHLPDEPINMVMRKAERPKVPMSRRMKANWTMAMEIGIKEIRKIGEIGEIKAGSIEARMRHGRPLLRILSLDQRTMMRVPPPRAKDLLRFPHSIRRKRGKGKQRGPWRESRNSLRCHRPTRPRFHEIIAQWIAPKMSMTSTIPPPENRARRRTYGKAPSEPCMMVPRSKQKETADPTTVSLRPEAWFTRQRPQWLRPPDGGSRGLPLRQRHRTLRPGPWLGRWPQATRPWFRRRTTA